VKAWIKEFFSKAWAALASWVMELDPLAAFVLGILCVVVGVAILSMSNPAYLDPTDGPKLAIFLVLMTLLFVTYVAATPPTLLSIRNVETIAHRYDLDAQLFFRLDNPRLWLLMALFLIIDMAPFIWLSQHLPNTKFPHGQAVTVILTLAGAFAGYFLSCAVWQVDSAARVIFQDEDAVQNYRQTGDPAKMDERSKQLVDDYIGLRGELLQSLTILGLMVSLLTLSIGAFRYCNRNYDVALYQKFQPEFVLIIGVYYSGLLGLVLVPPYLRFIQSGRILRDVLNRPARGATQTVAEFLELRKKLEESLILGVGPTEAFRNSILILSPLFSGIVPLLVGLGSPDKKDEAATPTAAAPASPLPKATVSVNDTAPAPKQDAGLPEKETSPSSKQNQPESHPPISPPAPHLGR
jgi:hypothetical protein